MDHFPLSTLSVLMQIFVSFRLDERKRRKDFILERGLLNVKRQQALDRKRSKEERELYNRCRVFMRYHSMEEHEALVNGLIAERKLCQRIEELQVLSKADLFWKYSLETVHSTPCFEMAERVCEVLYYLRSH